MGPQHPGKVGNSPQTATQGYLLIVFCAVTPETTDAMASMALGSCGLQPLTDGRRLPILSKSGKIMLEKFGEKDMTKGDTVLHLARDRMLEQSSARNRLTTKASIAFSALAILATAKLPDITMGWLACGLLLVMYTCIVVSAGFFLRMLAVQSYGSTPLPHYSASTHKKKTSEQLKFDAAADIDEAFKRNVQNVNRMSSAFSRGIKFLMGALFFRMAMQYIDYADITF